MSFCSRLEAEQCPDVVVAALDTRLFHEKQTVHVDDVSGAGIVIISQVNRMHRCQEFPSRTKIHNFLKQLFICHAFVAVEWDRYLSDTRLTSIAPLYHFLLNEAHVHSTTVSFPAERGSRP